ncbi:MAG TPA: S9 family peptidase, partial [Thermomicrobiaceae bacterium]|nr:S9 family peptidase [Thermomicrobiaceae bacterium]
DGGEAIRACDNEGDIERILWSPDGRYLAFTYTDPETDEEKKRKEEKDDAYVWDTNYKYRRLWLLDVETREAKAISPEDRQVNDVCWSPGGERLAVNTSPTPRIDDHFKESRLSVVPRDGGAITDIAPLPCVSYGLTWSPDGDSIAYLGPGGRTVSGDYVYAMPVNGGEAVNLTPGLTGTPEGIEQIDGEMLITMAEGVQSALYRLSWSGELRPLQTQRPWGSISGVSADADGVHVAMIWEDANNVPDVWTIDFGRSGGERPTRRTHFHPELETAALGTTEIVRWESDPGVEVEGILVLPAGYEEGKRYPFVAQVHGGPTGRYTNSFQIGGSRWAQYLAGRGYAVLMGNPRGSTGRGPEFINSLFGDVGGCEFRDLMSGVDAMIERGVADPERLGVGGWSWGGYMTAWTVSQTSRFKAAVMGAGLPNMISDNGLGDIPSANLSYFETDPYHDPESYFARSAIRYISQATTPTLIVHGQSDARVHPAEGQEMYIALRTLGVETQFVTYPREPHGFQERKHLLDLFGRVLDWYDRHLKDGSDAAAQPAAREDSSSEDEPEVRVAAGD